eukprot:GHRR01022096.1.p1 GENE.GHRR01022096.1~~GHRR01022096.1.p1  ORF type:complete len:120 (-),score=17.03 GHRR01022096.1:30-389(-)
MTCPIDGAKIHPELHASRAHRFAVPLSTLLVLQQTHCCCAARYCLLVFAARGTGTAALTICNLAVDICCRVLEAKLFQILASHQIPLHPAFQVLPCQVLARCCIPSILLKALQVRICHL